MQQQHDGGRSGGGGGRGTCCCHVCPSLSGCIHVVPLRPHGLFVATIAAVVSLVGLLVSATLLLRNVILLELASLPPGCTGYTMDVSWLIDYI